MSTCKQSHPKKVIFAKSISGCIKLDSFPNDDRDQCHKTSKSLIACNFLCL